MRTFAEWLESSFDRRCKIGLYAPVDDSLGQYPPLYATARSPDAITYIDIAYDGKQPPGKNGIMSARGDIVSYTVVNGKKVPLRAVTGKNN